MSRAVKLNVLKYGLIVLMLNFGVNFLFAYNAGFYRASSSGYIIEKTNNYKKHASAYNLVFIGDSRTYCAMHPEILDDLLGVKSINVSKWAHWFPTQYSQIKELLEFIPSDTTVVWSVGHSNFSFDGIIRKVYPIKVQNAFNLMGFGYQWSSMKQNLIAYTPGLYLWGFRQEIYDMLKVTLEQNYYTKNDQATSLSQARDGVQNHVNVKESIQAKYADDPGVDHIEYFEDQKGITSYALCMVGGGYYRVEVCSAFFREKQKQNELALQEKRHETFEPNPAALEAFKAILKLFKKRNVKLVVNEFEEAPYFYRRAEYGMQCRKFMKEIRILVENSGYPYTRVAFETFSDHHYFDFNHLNSNGIEKFSGQFVNLIKPLL